MVGPSRASLSEGQCMADNVSNPSGLGKPPPSAWKRGGWCGWPGYILVSHKDHEGTKEPALRSRIAFPRTGRKALRGFFARPLGALVIFVRTNLASGALGRP